MIKTFKIVMVSVERKSKGVSLFLDKSNKLTSKWLYKNDDDTFEPNHLYILSEEKIQAGDLCHCSKTNEIMECLERSTCPFDKKIVASTDKEITPNSWIPEVLVASYVKAYNDGAPIMQVDLDMNTNNGGLLKEKHWTVKTLEDGSVVVVKEKMYSEEDLELRMQQYGDYVSNRVLDTGKYGE